MDGEMCQVYISFHYKLDKLKGTQNLGSLVSKKGPQNFDAFIACPKLNVGHLSGVTSMFQ